MNLKLQLQVWVAYILDLRLPQGGLWGSSCCYPGANHFVSPLFLDIPKLESFRHCLIF